MKTKTKTLTNTDQRQTSATAPHHSSPAPTGTNTDTLPGIAPRSDSPERQDHRLPIDSEARKQNRKLPTPKVLELLKASNPGLFNLAEVVGKWVWVQFRETPAPELRQSLAQLGFHWNRERQAWQHPCGQFTLSSPHDPHEKYASYFPADTRAAS